MDPTVAAIFGGIAGLVIATLAWGAISLSDRERAVPSQPEPALPAGVGDVLAVLRSSGIVVDSDGWVVNNSPVAVALGLVRNGRLAHPALSDLADSVRADGVIRELELELHRGEPRTGDSHWAGTYVHARVAPLSDRHVLLLVEDRTQSHRVEQVRRDFLGNVSHELKTPVGAISLLVETLMEVREDPESVEYFGGKLVGETRRMGQMISELISLSKLQGAESLPDPQVISLDSVVEEAFDRCHLAAETANIELVKDQRCGALVMGDKSLLVTSVSNLVTNAIYYSPAGTPVSLSREVRDDVVRVRVTDRGIGIAPEDQKRLFERFFRVDKARSRNTGGTGLGLAIVKHVMVNHGGRVSVWSRPGTGSTFTLELPRFTQSETTLPEGESPVVPSQTSLADSNDVITGIFTSDDRDGQDRDDPDDEDRRIG